jgi:hypothetical protein
MNNTSGYRWGGNNNLSGTNTSVHWASLWHDLQVAALNWGPAAQFGWIVRAWSWNTPGVPLGPYGQFYRLYGTIGFGVIGVLQLAIGWGWIWNVPAPAVPAGEFPDLARAEPDKQNAPRLVTAFFIRAARGLDRLQVSLGVATA